MPKQKFYVVWHGRKPGVYDSWEESKKQTDGFFQAKHKSFKTRVEAEKAFTVGSHYQSEEIEKPILAKPADNLLFELEPIKQKEPEPIGEPIMESISVDAAWNTDTRDMEYQAVDTKTRELIFHKGPFKDGTNNVGEFLALVHAIAYCQKNNISLPIYSDSITALAWVRDKKARTTLEETSFNKNLIEILERAVNWLKENSFENKLLKWETKAWGENPADFGRK